MNVISSFSTYAGSEWSFAQLKFKECDTYKSILWSLYPSDLEPEYLGKTIGTVYKGKVHVLSRYGTYYVAPLTEDVGGELTKESDESVMIDIRYSSNSKVQAKES